jgi:hypothetical protein
VVLWLYQLVARADIGSEVRVLGRRRRNWRSILTDPRVEGAGQNPLGHRELGRHSTGLRKVLRVPNSTYLRQE